MTHPIVAMLGSKKDDDPLNLRKRKTRKVLASVATIGLLTFNVYHVSKQIAPGQQQFSIVTERVSRDHGGDLLRDVIAVTQVVFLTSGTSYARPADWDASNNTVECIGGGQGGQNGLVCSCFCLGGNGGTGGGYAKSSNLNIGATAAYTIGAGGTTGFGVGGSTTFNSSAIVARGGGSATAQVGTTTRLGGAGVAGTTTLGGGGGGAAGPNAAGSNASGATGGRGDGTFGGVGGTPNGGAGSPGAEYTATVGGTAGSGGGGAGTTNVGATAGGQGGLYGGAGGSGFNPSHLGGIGRPGLIVITYVPLLIVVGLRRRQYLRR